MEIGPLLERILAQARSLGNRIHPEDLVDILPKMNAEQIGEVMDRLAAAGVRVDPETPDPSAHFVMEVSRGRDGRYHVWLHRDRASGHGQTLPEAIDDLRKSVEVEHLPFAERSPESVERLVRAGRLTEVLRALR